MPESVSSGLGRNGPWLRNRWLRVETRQDDGSIAPVALEGAFRPTERALARVRLTGGRELSFERCDYDVRPYEDELGRGRLLALVSRMPRRGATLRREVVVYENLRFCVTRCGVTNESSEPMPLEALEPFATDDGRGRIQLAAKPADWRIFRNGWQSWSPTMSLGGASQDLRSAPAVLAPEAPTPEPGRFASDDVGVLFDPITGRSMLAGTVTARDLLTQALVDAPARSLRVRCLADGLPLAPGETAWSERVALDVVGGPNEQLARYADALGRLMRARVPLQTPAGWCSWYYFYTQVTEDDVVRNLRFLERHRRELPVQTVQIDDGYQADIGDWLTVNEKFPSGMAWLASEIRSAGYTPGIWLAPLLLAETSRMYVEHPEWVVRDERGEPVVAIQNWQRNSFGLDGSHPEARAWLRDLFHEVCDGWGYDYVKIDFLFAGAIAGRRHDPAATRARAYRAALDAIRGGVGPDRFILGCGALMAPSVGVFDGNRIGPDVAPFWRNLTHEERQRPGSRARRPDDDLSAETAVRNTLNRWWMHGRLWANDPDCLLVRADRTKLTLDETRTLASAIGLTAGMMLSSDELELVPADRLEIASMLLPPLPRSALPSDLMERDMPERLELDLDGLTPARIIGLFNFDDEARDLVAALPPGRWHAVELWEQRSLGTLEGEVAFALVAPHACRVVALARAADTPALVATTAHIGMGALDVLESGFDSDTGVLRARIAPVGRARRRIFLSHADSLHVASLDGRSCNLRVVGDTCYIDITVEQECVLEATYRLGAEGRAG